MGCTSSTANMLEPQTSTTDDIDNTITPEDSKEHVKEINNISCKSGALEQKQVLPECEIKINQNKIVNDNMKSNADLLAVDANDIQDTFLTEHNDGNVQSTPVLPTEENFVSLKDVVEKVITENADEKELITNVIEIQSVHLDRQIDEETFMESDVKEAADEIEYNEEEAKESTSPTQSEDSRATRWEALADIAAELPPSLAVDPLTGQIYSLTK